MIHETDSKLQRAVVTAALESPHFRDAVAMVPEAWFTDRAARMARHLVFSQGFTDPIGLGTAIVTDPGLRDEFGAAAFDFQMSSIYGEAGLLWHINQVRESFVRHSIECLPDTIAKAAGAGLTADERLAHIEEAVNNLRHMAESGKTAYSHIKAGALEAIADIEEAQAAIAAMSATRSIPTGIEDLDAMLFGGGFHPGQFVIVAARPGIGKSSFMINAARNQAHAGRKVGIISLEMTRRELAQVGAQIAANVSMAKFFREPMSAGDLGRAVAGLEDIGGCEIYVDDSSSLTADQVAARTTHMVRVEGCEVVYVDYVQKIRFTGKLDAVQELNRISERLTQTAKDLQIPLVGLAQLHRDAANGVPRLEQIKGSSQFEQDAHIALLLHRPEAMENYDVEKMEIVVAKQRRGASNTIVATRFERQTQRIY